MFILLNEGVFFLMLEKKDGYILGRLDMFCRKIYVQCKVK